MVNGLKLLLANIFIIGMMSSFASEANYESYDCRYSPGFHSGTTRVSFGSQIIIPKNHPIGTTIKEIRLDQLDTKGHVVYCNRLVPASWDKPDFAPAHYNNDAIYESGVPGVGIRINNWGPTNYGIDWFPRKSTTPFTCSPPPRWPDYKYYCGQTWGYLTVQLIKIAPTTGSGIIEGRILTRARFGYGSGSIVHSFYLAETRVVTPTPSCSLARKTTLVNMGEIRASEFRGINSTAGTKDFRLEFSCDPNAKVNIILDGRPAKSGINNIWALDYGSDNVTATGIGLQILFYNQLLEIRKPIKANAEYVTYFSFPLQARYIQTHPRITPGKADVTTTITLTYE
ncbi:fimbrial protein [Xenorhabdus indica]|uniref:fimbrial protein n=1 Tax=Xenorhabdus indica TaxID=333964 RepID=UPI00165709F2|nr:fimbrial protein [Xenorhabdus indica]MBC8945052.1 fimbrial adhesin protein precursor [Xenorhabdus indica]